MKLRRKNRKNIRLKIHRQICRENRKILHSPKKKSGFCVDEKREEEEKGREREEWRNKVNKKILVSTFFSLDCKRFA